MSTAWSSSESDHSGVYPPFMYSSYHLTHLSMYSVMSRRSLTTTYVLSLDGIHCLGRS
ncbi:MAG: hypothetical protein Q4Q58_01390 [Thermoplasmata archaeon]|nr:hypothetical protein [Thermoplasmata archaeon]